MSPTPSHFDVAIIGAGAAGLAAAVTLSQSGQSVCLLEARDRLGGRIFTLREPDFPLPIELGAELIHGRSPSIFRWLQRVGETFVDVGRHRWSKQGKSLVQGRSLFEAMKNGLDAIRPPKHDLPFADFLDAHTGGKLTPRVRQFARALVEGFDAADAQKVSTLQTLDGWSGGAAADAPTFRPLNGYGTLIDGMSTLLDRDRTQVHLNTVVNQVEWSVEGVKIGATQFGRVRTFEARKCIVTLPLGVLQASDASAVRFTPSLDRKIRPLTQLASGSVIKVLLKFREPFWETVQKCRYRDSAFFHAPALEFPTFWTTLPMRAPLLTAWMGGPKATRLSTHAQDEIVACALRSVTALFDGKVRAASLLAGAHVHNWQSDPFARGAYSYVLAGGRSARHSLSKPLDDALFFAGEAADTSGEAATVAGALETGERAAQSILRARTKESH